MKKTFTTIALTITGLVVFAQQDAQFSMNMFNRLDVNPGYAGTSKALCATVLARQQWTNFPGAPKTGLLSLDYGDIAPIHGGVGLTIADDQLGFDKTMFARLAYSFHQPINGGAGTLGIGIDGGMMQKSLSGNFIAPDGTTTNTGGGADAAIPWNGSSSMTYDVGFGLYYTSPNLYVGLSSSHLPEQQFSKQGSIMGTVLNKWDFKYTVARHYYVMAGYTFKPAQMWDITPSILVKSDASSTQLDLNLMAKWNQMVFGGVSYRMSDAIVAIVGLERIINTKMTGKFGYSYDITTSNIKNHSNGTHEIMLGFCYKMGHPPKQHGGMNQLML